MKRFTSIVLALVAAAAIALPAIAQNNKKTYKVNAIPKSAAELKALSIFNLKDPFCTAALTVIAFAAYESDPDACYEMLDVLNGPTDWSAYDKSFCKNQFAQYPYVARSYFAGATVANGYKPTVPYTVTVTDNPNSRSADDFITLYIRSAGADNPRAVSFRKKPSTGEWFVTGYNGLLAGIRKPAADDPWY